MCRNTSPGSGLLDELRWRYADLIRTRFPKIPRRVSGYENLNGLLPENGFNVEIEQGSGRSTLHVAHLLAQGLT